MPLLSIKKRAEKKKLSKLLKIESFIQAQFLNFLDYMIMSGTKIITPAIMLLITFIAAPLFSQPAFGVKGGLSLSNFWGDGVDAFHQNENIADFGIDRIQGRVLPFVSGGLFFRFDIIPSFLSIQPELLYIRQGENWKLKSAGHKEYTNIHVDYLTVPVCAKLMIPFENAPLTSGVYAGPAVSLRVHANAKNIDALPDLHNRSMPDWGTNITGKTNPLDFGLAAGFNMDIASGPGEIVIDFRFQWGFIEVFEMNKDFRNYSFSMMAGYQIFLR